MEGKDGGRRVSVLKATLDARAKEEGTHKILIFPTSCAPAKLSRCSYNMVSIF
jgi:hypothetical protein